MYSELIYEDAAGGAVIISFDDDPQRVNLHVGFITGQHLRKDTILAILKHCLKQYKKDIVVTNAVKKDISCALSCILKAYHENKGTTLVFINTTGTVFTIEAD